MLWLLGILLTLAVLALACIAMAALMRPQKTADYHLICMVQAMVAQAVGVAPSAALSVPDATYSDPAASDRGRTFVREFPPAPDADSDVDLLEEVVTTEI